ncbi:MAG: alpha/beta fold hydrolase [Candidatus Aminicenantes bacterium]|nr:MAG: alpha/beta fold hydrolase [Candidatus Aminicenantes bacterium]
MKIFKLWFFLGLSLLIFVSCSKIEEDPFPSIQEVTGIQAGDITWNTGDIEVKDEKYRADFGILNVLENREKADSRSIHLPVVRIHAKKENASEPVFLLAGGPGQTNIWNSPPVWLLENHDVVMVGYRGVDGSVSLECPEVIEAMEVKEYPLSHENIEKLGRAYSEAYQRLNQEGVDIDRYTMVDVIDDTEEARKAMGYEGINLYSVSYGTRIAYIFGLRYPSSIRRSLMISVNPPGHFVWEPDKVDEQLRYYAELWNKDPDAVSRTPDLIKTIQDVLDSLPKKWLLFRIDPDKIRSGMFMFLYHRDTAAQVFDAFVAAEEGDYSGLALLSFFYDRMMPKALNWGDSVSKALSADYDPARDYEAEMMPPDSILGSPMSKLWGLMKYGGWPIKPISEEYRKLQDSEVETLMVNGNIDFSTPAENARDELLPHLTNGQLVILSEMGHSSDVVDTQPEAFRHLAETFFFEGVVDDSQFQYEPMNFTPSQSAPEMAKQYVRRFALMGGGAIVLIIVIIILIVWLIKRRKRRKE